MVKAIVIGFGSIGQRHALVLSELGVQVSVVSRRDITLDGFLFFKSLAEAINSTQPNLIVIANETSLHLETLKQIFDTGYQGKILTEKPLFHQSNQSFDRIDTSQVYVGYNLRFHPLLADFKKEFQKSSLLSAWMYCGQYLPNWRKDRDYQSNYSSQANLGGGVLRDLSHEIDFICHLQPNLTLDYAKGGQWSDLKMSSDDHFILNFSNHQTGKSHIGIHLNCVDRLMQRLWIFNFEHDSFSIDMNQGTIRSSKETLSISSDRNDSYRNLHQALLSGNTNELCTYKEGLATCLIIDQAEEMSQS